MTAFDAPAEIEVKDTPEMLEFWLTPSFNLFGNALASLIVSCFAAVGVKSWWSLFAGPTVIGAIYLCRYSNKSPRILRVTDTTLFAFGRGDEQRLRWQDVIRLEYRSIEDGPSGLAAKISRLDWKWLVEDVSQSEANMMMETIWRRFPLVENAVEPPGLLDRWRNRDGSISLGLNEPR